MPHEVIMPALGMAQNTGVLLSWLKKPGDAIETGDVLMEVETDKSVMEVEALASGFLTNVTAAAGDEVPVGKVVALISATAEDDQSRTQEQSKVKSENTQNDSPKEKADDALPKGKNVIMPALGMAQDTGLIIAWRKQAGDPIKAGDVLLEVETDKSAMEVEAEHDGYVAAILAEAEQAVPVGSTIAIISVEKPKVPMQKAHNAEEAHTSKEPTEAKNLKSVPNEKPSAVKNERVAAPIARGERILASPKARRLAKEQGLKLELLVQEGVPQPFHVSDLETLKSLGALSESEATAPIASQINAIISRDSFARFTAWLNDEMGFELADKDIWLRFAVAAFRQATNKMDESICSEIRLLNEKRGIHVDPDRIKFSERLSDVEGIEVDLIIRDFTASAIYSSSTNASPMCVLTIGADREDYLICLHYRTEQLDEDQAINFVDGFTERLSEPLRHLL